MVDEKQKELQEKVLIYQILQNQLEEFGKQATALETRMAELENTEHTLKDMKEMKEDSETLVPLGGGCFGHGKLTNQDTFLVEIGAGIMVNKKLPQAVALIGERKQDVEDVGKKLQAEMEKVSSTMNKLVMELQQINESRTQTEESDSDNIVVE